MDTDRDGAMTTQYGNTSLFWLRPLLLAILALLLVVPNHAQARHSRRISAPTGARRTVSNHPERKALNLTFCCTSDNDLFRALAKDGHRFARYESASEAVNRAAPGSGVLILAGFYPLRPTAVDPRVLDSARAKRLSVYLEYPASVPGLNLGPPRRAEWERVVVTTHSFGPRLPQLKILSAHHAWYLPVGALPASADPLLSLARVAGYGTAVFGLPHQAFPLLLNIHRSHVGGSSGDGSPDPVLLVATSGLSNFLRGRYAPPGAWIDVWDQVLSMLDPAAGPVSLRAEPSVQPAYGREDRLPADAERRALAAGAHWYRSSRLLVTADRDAEIHRMLTAGVETAPIPPASPAVGIGDGTLGILEGYASGIAPDGTQRQRIVLRADCNAESAAALAIAGLLLHDSRDRQIAKNLLDFVYFRSGMQGGARGNPDDPAYGLVAWGAVSPAWEVANYGDDNARMLLATMASGALLKDGRWDNPMLRCLMANFRTTGALGFRGDRIDMPDLERRGWQAYYHGEPVNTSPHFESYLWACYLRAYEWTGYRPFLDRTLTGIRRMMAAYPTGWRLGLNLERARMLLCLSWLVRVDDSKETRGWLHEIAADLLAGQQPCGAILESLSERPGGSFHGAPTSNESYGTEETSLIQENGDPASDQLYTSGFALLGLHEAAAATGNPLYRKAEDRLAAYLCRIQIRSTAHPWLNGAWFRAFDTRDWDYWSSSADAGWGAWSVETGWGTAWTLTVLGLRLRGESLWDLTSNPTIAERFKVERTVMGLS